MKSILMAGAVLALSLAAAPALAATNVVQNGDFENGFTDWTANDWNHNSNEHGDPTFAASSPCVGDTCIHDANGAINGIAYLYQDVATVTGDTYTLTFDYAGAGDPNELAVLFGGATAFDQTDVADVYTTYTVSGLVASGTSTRLEFFGRQDPSHSGLDNVSLVDQTPHSDTPGVPEPGTWMMMIMGLGGVGALLRDQGRQLRAPI
jgi:hypothetical protein